MPMIEIAFDAVLLASLLLVAVGAIVVRDLLRAIVLFITVGLLMALVWLRLGAPDIALAEAAIGAGLTGALLLDTLGYLRRERASRAPDADAPV
jgi:energy-converting hydrogenase B subunit D